MDIYKKLPEDIQRNFFMYFSHPNAHKILHKNSEILLKELKEYNSFKRDVMEKIIPQSYLKYHDFIDMRSVRFSIGWYTTSQRWLYKKRIRNHSLSDSSSLELS